MTEPLQLAPRPCSTCPYRKDTPVGIWHPEEYEKLRGFDADAFPPSIATFHCHQENATGVPTACRGWVSCHGFDSVAIRLAVMRGSLTVEQVESPCPVELYASGAEAAEAGLAGVPLPSAAAVKEMGKLARRGAAKGEPR